MNIKTTITFRKGPESQLPNLRLKAGEPAFTTDTNRFYIGNGTDNIEIAKQSSVNSINDSLSKYVRNDIDSIINAKLTINNDNVINPKNFLTFKSVGETLATGDSTLSEYMFAPINAISEFGAECANGGIEFKNVGVVNDGSGDSIPGVLALSTDLVLNKNLYINNNNLVSNLNADLLDGKHSSSFVAKQSSVSNVILSTTSLTTVASYTPSSQGNYLIGISLRVTSTTTVTVSVTYTNNAGAQTNVILNSQSTSAGTYSLTPLFINATSSIIKVNITASNANTVYASASIIGV